MLADNVIRQFADRQSEVVTAMVILSVVAVVLSMAWSAPAACATDRVWYMTEPEVAPAPTIAQLGEISVTAESVHTPAGKFPLRGSVWQISEQWLPEQRTPRWAIVLALVGICLVGPFSLLFLLVRHTVYRGIVQVTAKSWNHQYTARIPVVDQAQAQHLHSQVNYVRSLATL